MEVSKRRIFQKHLEPARPLRRCFHIETEPELDADECTQAQEIIMCNDPLETEKAAVEINQLYLSINLDQQKKGQISYSRDFLISLARCPEAKRKPHFLADHSILASIIRDAGELGFHDILKNIAREQMWRK
ncbi:uncharacterized protein C8orf88 homolog [Salarias fasciatus]|uniref:uncharacterized protein C8orf88 homolog n=1 Tax=Salarias fasciatus TaxID=181472 RepID=UPI001176F6E1|nr:uncharacterized protein C8orf88-like [Salarias fasciatus]XP_029958446.1 uncharacterized protein C8orf88-like [Salarias fasciatus]XP_029958447.1 uncharacterized protein C8orf88-like [Salarias fasciatus]